MSKSKYETLGPCLISKSATIQTGSVIGKKFRKYLSGGFEKFSKTKIDKGVYVGYNCMVGTGSHISSHTILDDNSTIESRVTLGRYCLVIYRAQICNDVVIGDNCVIGGLIGERTVVGNTCRIFGNVVHTQLNPMNPWDDDDSEEEAVVIHDKVFVGFNSVLAGNISIGPQAYILAGSIITEDVPPMHIAFGRNQVVHCSKWRGGLKESNLFK